MSLIELETTSPLFWVVEEAKVYANTNIVKASSRKHKSDNSHKSKVSQQSSLILNLDQKNYHALSYVSLDTEDPSPFQVSEENIMETQ